jgi:heme/copper-type cytochrome/quinol oxidase subunit 3
MKRTWTPLRIAVLIAAALGTLFWLGSIVQWWQIANTRRDGFELMGLALSTAFFVALVLPTLVLALTARWLPLGAILGAAVVALASDTLWPWLPW